MVRIPLGVLFLLVAERTYLSLAVLAAAGLSDVLDGWTARRRRPGGDGAPHHGDWLDPVCDKVFVAAVMIGIYLAHRPPPELLVLTVTREILQLVAMVVYRIVPSLRRLQYNFRANAVGKATTVTQFVTAGAFVLELPIAPPLAGLSALLGVASVAAYLSRARSLARAER